MQLATVEILQAVAPALFRGEIPNPCPVVVQRAIAILDVLSDGQWHTAATIAVRIGISRKYAYDILSAVKNNYGLLTHRRKGWKLSNNTLPVAIK